MIYEDRHRWWALRPWKRHSLVLAVAGLVYVGIGISYMRTEPTVDRIMALAIALKWMPLESWGVVFIFSGLLAIVSSRWPPFSKTWGYMVLTGLSAGWAMFYLVGVIFYGSPISNITGTTTWGLIAFLWWAISGLFNPNDVRLTPHLYYYPPNPESAHQEPTDTG